MHFTGNKPLNQILPQQHAEIRWLSYFNITYFTLLFQCFSILQQNHNSKRDQCWCHQKHCEKRWLQFLWATFLCLPFIGYYWEYLLAVHCCTLLLTRHCINSVVVLSKQQGLFSSLRSKCRCEQTKLQSLPLTEHHGQRVNFCTTSHAESLVDIYYCHNSYS